MAFAEAEGRAPSMLGFHFGIPGAVESEALESSHLREAAVGENSSTTLQKRWCSGMKRNSEIMVQELSAEKDSEVTFDEVVTARKQRSQQYKRQQMRFLLLPGSRELNFWKATMVTVVLLAVILAPLEMAFSYSPTITSLTWLSRLIDILFILDMMITFNVATSSKGRLETDRKTLSLNYAKTWLLPDLLINFPWDIMLQEPGKTRKIAKILKLPKVFRVTRLLRAAGQEAHYFGTAANICGILLMGHYLSCIWVMLLIDCTAELDAEQLCPEMLTVYLQGLSVGLATLGGSDGWLRFILDPSMDEGTVNFEWPAQYGAFVELVAALSCLMGFVLIGMLFSNLAHAMDRRHSHTRLFHARVANLQAAANQHQIPQELYNRIKRHYYYVWSCGSDTSKAILSDATLSLDLRRELAYCFYGDILKQVPFLEMVDKHFLQQLCEFVEIEIFAAQDRIICAGDVGTELYFVAVGEVEVVLPQAQQEKGTVIKVLHEGSFFGELGLLFPDSKHKVDVYGATSGWLLVVPRGTLETLCTEELLETFRFVAIERLRKQPEMGFGMMVASMGEDAAASEASQETGSEEWNPHEKPKEEEEEVPQGSQVTDRQEIRKSRSLSGSMDFRGDGAEPMDLHAQLKQMTCRTEFFRKPQMLRRQTYTVPSFELTGVGHAGRRASMYFQEQMDGSVTGQSASSPLLQTLHKVEHGMNTLLSRMHTIDVNSKGGDMKTFDAVLEDEDPPQDGSP
eukprot:symbB.v1.2.024639.t1/scaffold2349.1/size81648/3